MADARTLLKLGISTDLAVALRAIDGFLLAATPLAAIVFVEFAADGESLATPLSCLAALLFITMVRRLVIWPAARRLFANAYGQGLALRSSTLAQLMALPLGLFRTIGSDRLIQAASEDVLWLENHASYTRPELVTNIATLVLCTISATVIWPLLGLIAICAMGMGFSILAAARKKLQSGFERRAINLASISHAMQEQSDGITVLRAFSTSDDANSDFKGYVRKLRAGAWRGVKAATPIAILFRMTIELSVGIAILIALLFLSTQDRIAQGDVISFVAAILLILAASIPARNFSTYSAMIILAQIARRNIGAIHDLSIRETGARRTKPDQFDVSYSDVGFRRGKQKIAGISGISFIAPENTLTAIVGLNGSGKTTCFQMLMRFWDPDHGDIRIGGVNIRDFDNAVLADLIAPVFQEALLFDDTIAANIRIGKPSATAADIERAARIANIHDAIMRFDRGYETPVGALGNRLSGGERQRICIARAMLREAPIVILDEATASLDPENQEAIQSAVASLIRDRSVFVIAHNLSTIVAADQIMVMENGLMVGCGTHLELVTGCHSYQRLWQRSQGIDNWKV